MFLTSQVALYVKDVTSKNGITQNPNLLDIEYISKIAKSIGDRLSKLFKVSINDILSEPSLYEIICFETFIHFSDSNSPNKRKSIINNLIKNPELISPDDISSFFYPILQIKFL